MTSVEKIKKVITENPGCVILYDNDAWTIDSAEQWAKRYEAWGDPLLRGGSGEIEYGDLIIALAELAGAKIEYP